MKYLPQSKHDSAFTLVEVAISIGILVLLVALTAPFTINFYRRFQLISERNLLTTLLREARTMSMAGEGSMDHGIYIASAQYTLFEGPSYEARTQSKDQTFPREESVAITGPQEFTFTYLTGKTASKSFILDNTTKQSSIYVNKHGRIDWE